MEYRRKCQVCGKIYCYTDADKTASNVNAIAGALGSLAAGLNAIDGSMFGAFAFNAQSDRANSRVTDFTRCPSCGSTSTVELTAEQWEQEQRRLTTSVSPAAQPVTPTTKSVEINANATAESLLKRVGLFLEDSEWDTADAYCERVLDVEPENAMAYLGKAMAELHVHNQSELPNCAGALENSSNFKKACRFASGETAEFLDSLLLRQKYNKAVALQNAAFDETGYLRAGEAFRACAGFLDSDNRRDDCIIAAEESSKAIKEMALEELYKTAIEQEETGTLESLQAAEQAFLSLEDWKDARAHASACKSKLEALRTQLKRQEEEKQITVLQRRRKQKNLGIVLAVVALIVGAAVIAMIVCK